MAEADKVIIQQVADLAMRLRAHDLRVARLEQRDAANEARAQHHNDRLDGMDKRLGKIEGRMDAFHVAAEAHYASDATNWSQQATFQSELRDHMASWKAIADWAAHWMPRAEENRVIWEAQVKDFKQHQADRENHEKRMVRIDELLHVIVTAIIGSFFVFGTVIATVAFTAWNLPTLGWTILAAYFVLGSVGSIWWMAHRKRVEHD